MAKINVNTMLAGIKETIKVKTGKEEDNGADVYDKEAESERNDDRMVDGAWREINAFTEW